MTMVTRYPTRASEPDQSSLVTVRSCARNPHPNASLFITGPARRSATHDHHLKRRTSEVPGSGL
jgi:hypothetical protein